MGGQLDVPEWRSPCRGEEGGENQAGGSWGRMEDLNNPFDFTQEDLIYNKFVSRVEWREDFWMKVKVLISTARCC